MADSGEPVEVTALRTNLVFITDAVTVGGTPQWFADRLVEKAFITHRDVQGILGTLGVSPAQKASQLMNSVFAKIDLSDDKRHMFLDFVNIFSHDLVYKHLVNKLMRGVLAEEQSSPQPQREQSQSPQYRAVLQYKDHLARSLANGPDQHLLNQFKIRGWLGPGADVSAPEMIDEALTRISYNVSNYEIFMGMLPDHSRVKAIVDAITALCPIPKPTASQPQGPPASSTTTTITTPGHSDRDNVISDIHLAVIARDHLTQWEQLRPFLGLSMAQEKEISKSYQTDYGMQKLKCLMMWKEVKGNGATYQALISAAKEAKDQLLADSVESLAAAYPRRVETQSFLQPSALPDGFLKNARFSYYCKAYSSGDVHSSSHPGQKKESPEAGTDTIMSKEEAESIVKRLLQEEGEFQQKNMVVVITGLMGAGKTTLLHWLFGKTPPPEYESTGTAKQAWRTLAHHTVDMKEFRLLELEEMYKLVAKAKKRVPSKNSAKGTKTRDEDHQDTTKENRNTEPENQDESTKDERGLEGEQTATSIGKMAEKVRENPGEIYAELELVHLIDTGGQPESLEVLPSVIHNADFVLLVVDLSKDLDECISPTLHKKGFKLEKSSLPTTNRQMIEQLAQTMAGRSGSKVIVIATHKDQVAKENRQHFIDKLSKFVGQALPDDALIPKTSDQNVFDIAFPEKEDEDNVHDRENILDIVRESIKRQVNRTTPVPIPVSFVLFEEEIMQHKQGTQNGVITLNDCLEISKKVEMSEVAVKAAVKYFHDNNILQYFESVGSGLVFTDPITLINFVDMLILISYRIFNEEHSNPFLSRAAIKDLKQGMITEEILKHKDLATSFVPGVFDENDAIEIFQCLYIIAKPIFTPSLSKSLPQKSKYIMMCLLPRLEQKEVEHQLERFGQTKPLLLHFGKGSPPDLELCCSPIGSFGGIIACLISKFKWRICTNIDKQQPECLYHDIVMLRPSTKSLEVTLVNKTIGKYFEVYVDLNGEKECELLQVRNDLRSAAELVLKTTQLELNVAEGFKCTCGRWKKQHTQFLMKDSEESKEYTLCEGGCRGEPQVFWITTPSLLQPACASTSQQVKTDSQERPSSSGYKKQEKSPEIKKRGSAGAAGTGESDEMSQLQHASTAEASERQGSGDRMVKGYSRSGNSRGKKRKTLDPLGHTKEQKFQVQTGCGKKRYSGELAPLTHAQGQKLVQTGHGKKRNRKELDSLPHAKRQEMQIQTGGVVAGGGGGVIESDSPDTSTGPLPPTGGVKKQSTRQPLGTSDLFDVKSELQPATARWKDICLALRLDPDKLDEIKEDNRDSSDCLTKGLTLWLKKNYDIERFGEPSWELLAAAVGDPAGGNDSALAEKIAERHGGGSSSMAPAQ